MKRLFKNSGIFFLADLLLKISGLLLLPLYTRYIEPATLGNIFLIIIISGFISMSLSFSIQSSIARFYYNYIHSKIKIKIMYTTIINYLIVSLTFFYVLLTIFAEYIFIFIDINTFPYIYIMLLSSYMTVFFTMIRSLLVVEQKAKEISYIMVLIGLFGLFVNVVLVINFDDKLLAYMLSMLVVASTQFIVFIYYSKDYYVGIRMNKNLKVYIKYSVQRFPTDLSAWVTTFTDRLMLNSIVGAYSNGIYSTGYRISQGVDIVIQSVNAAYVPYVFEKYKNFNNTNEKELVKVANYIFALYFSVALLMLLLSKEFVFMLDEKYSSSINVVVIIIIAYLINGIRLIFHNPMDYELEYVKYKSIIWTLAALLNIVLNLYLIPLYSYTGAAISTLISYLFSFIIIIYYSNKAIKIRYDIKSFLLIIVVFLFSSISILLPLSLLSILIKGFVYMIYIYLILKIIKIDFTKYINKLSFIFKGGGL